MRAKEKKKQRKRKTQHMRAKEKKKQRKRKTKTWTQENGESKRPHNIIQSIVQ